MNSLATTNELTDQLFQAVSMITDSKIQELKYDQTIEGTIKSNANKQQDLYVVTTEHTVFEAYSINGNEYHVGEAVYVNIPSGDYSKQKFIIGRKIDPDSGDTFPIRYTSPLQNFITFEDLTANSTPTMPKAYRANKPEDGREVAASQEYQDAMAALTTKWNLQLENKKRELAALITSYQAQIADLVDSKGNVIGSAGEDAKNIEVPLDPGLKNDAEYQPPHKPALITVMINGANDVHTEDETDWTLTQMRNKWQTIFKVARPTTVEDIPIWNLDEIQSAIFQAGVVFTESERAGILGNLWKQYWNDSDLDAMHSRLADRQAQYNRYTDLYNDAKAKVEEKYAQLDKDREREYQELQAQYAENTETNHNLLWAWKKGARSAATVCTKMGISTHWTTYLGAYAPLSGEYGLRIEVTGITKATEDQPSEIRRQSLYFKSSQMYGNTYAFALPREQQIIFDISKFFELESISVYFWQDHNFIDEFGNKIPYVNVQDNIRINGLRVALGMTVDEVEDERVFIYTYDKLTYGSANPLAVTSVEDLDLDKHLQFIWVHRDGDSYVLVNTAEQLRQYNAQIYWYQYDYNVEINGANEPERYAGANFRLLDNSTKRIYTFEEYLDYYSSTIPVINYRNAVNNKQRMYDEIQFKLDTHQIDEGEAAQQRRNADDLYDAEIANARIAVQEALNDLGTVSDHNRFTLNVTLDPEKLAERFRVAIKYGNNYRISDILTFSNLDTTLGEGYVEESDFIFKILRKSYEVTPEGTYTNGKIIVDEGRDSFFVYDELSKAMKDEANNDYSDIEWYIQIWMRTGKGDYIPLTVNDEASEADEHFSVKWSFPGVYTMIANVSNVTDAEAVEMLQLGNLIDDETSNDIIQLRSQYIYKTTQKFKIRNFWDVQNTNNTISATIARMGHTYHISKELYFGRSGTDGSEWTITIHQIEPETVGLREGQRFKLAASVQDRFGRRVESAGFIFRWHLLSPTLITQTSGETISNWQNSQWDIINFATYGNYLGNGITGFIRNNMPPIFKVEVLNCAPYPLIAYKSFMLTNNWGKLVREYQYSIPSRVEFKSNGQSPVYLASPFLKWSELNGEINYEYPVWELKQWQRQSNNTWQTLDPPYFFRLLNTKIRAAQLTTNEVITLPLDVNRRVNNALQETADSYMWPMMQIDKSYTLDEAEEYLDELEAIAAEGWLQGGQDNAVLIAQTALIRGTIYDIILEGAGLLRGSYTEYTLDPYIDPVTNKIRTSWAWVEDMDQDYYTYIGYNLGQDYYRQAVVCCRNVYPSSLVNTWDGHLTIDEENNSIMAQMISAGSKDGNNRFSGVMMGDWHNHNDGSIDIPGLYGFEAGVQVFGLKNDATGFIGKAGKGQIVFNGKYSLISNYDRTCYLNLDPITQTSDSQFTPGSYYGYSPYFLYAQVNRRVDTTSMETVEDLQTTVRWASKFYNDPTHDYFVVDPNHGMMTTGGVIASYGKIGNWMIGKHGMYQYFSGEGLEVIKDNEGKPLTGRTLPPNSRYMYLGYNITGGWIDDPNVINYYRQAYEASFVSFYHSQDIADRNALDGKVEGLINKSLADDYNASHTDKIECDFEYPNEWAYDNPSAIKVSSIYRCINIEHQKRLDQLYEYGRNLHETVDMLFEMLDWLKEQEHDGVRDLPNTVFQLDPYHYMNVGWGYKYVADYLDRCLEEVGYGKSSSEYAYWIDINITDILNQTTWDASNHYHYNSNGQPNGTYRTGWWYTMCPILGYSSASYSQYPRRTSNNSATYSYSTAYVHNPAVTVHTINPYYPNDINDGILEMVITDCRAGYEIYLQDCYNQLMQMYYLAIEQDTIPQSDWDYMRANWPGFFTSQASSQYDATVQVLINHENAKYEAKLQELYRYDNEHKYAIYCGYYPDWENQYAENDYHKPLFSVNWRGYMTSRAGKIGSTSPWYITDYGLTQTNNFGTIFIGDPKAPSDKNLWYSVMSRDRKNLTILGNESTINGKKIYLSDIFTPGKTSWTNEVNQNKAVVLRWNEDRTAFLVKEGTLTAEELTSINNGTALVGIPSFNEFGEFAIYAGQSNPNGLDDIRFGVRMDGSVWLKRAEMTDIRISYSAGDHNDYTDVNIYNNRFTLPDGSTGYSYQVTHDDGLTQYLDEYGNMMTYQGSNLTVTGIDGTITNLNPDGTTYSYLGPDGTRHFVEKLYPTSQRIQNYYTDPAKDALIIAKIIEQDAILTTGKLSGWFTSGNGTFLNYKVLETLTGYKIAESIALDAYNSQIRMADNQIVLDGINGVFYIGRPLVGASTVNSETGTTGTINEDTLFSYATWAQMYMGAIGIQVQTAGLSVYNATLTSNGRSYAYITNYVPTTYTQITNDTVGMILDGEASVDDPGGVEVPIGGGYIWPLNLEFGENIKLPLNLRVNFDYYDIGHTRFNTSSFSEDMEITSTSKDPGFSIYNRSGTALHFLTDDFNTVEMSLGPNENLSRFGFVHEGCLYFPLTDGSALGIPRKRWTIYSHDIFVSSGHTVFLGEDDQVASLEYVNIRFGTLQQNIIALNDAIAALLKKINGALKRAQSAINSCIKSMTSNISLSGGKGTFSYTLTTYGGSSITSDEIWYATSNHSHDIELHTAGGILQGTISPPSDGEGQISCTLTSNESISISGLSGSGTFDVAGATKSLDWELQSAVEDCFENCWDSISATASGNGGEGGGSFTVTVTSPKGRTKEFSFSVSINTTVDWSHSGSVTGRGSSAGDGHYLGNGSTGYTGVSAKITSQSWSVS